MQRVARFYKISEGLYNAENISPADREYDEIKLPARATAGSAGYDFFAPFDIALEPGQSVSVPTGIRAKISEGWVLMLFPRSGLGFKYGLRLANTVGVIDSDYFYSEGEGHIKIKITNGEVPVFIKKGSAFAQGVFLPYGITEDDRASGTRDGGFGSTDK